MQETSLEQLQQELEQLKQENRRLQLAEIAHQESERRFHHVVEGLGEGILITDLEDVIQYVNARLVEITGYARTELLGRRAYELLVPPEDWELCRERNRQRSDDIPGTYLQEMLRKGGQRFWSENTASPLHDAEGRVVGTLGAVADVTERVLAEQRLQEREAMYRQAIAVASGVVYQLDLVRQTYTHLDERIEELIGYTVEETTPELWSRIGFQYQRRGALAGLSVQEAVHRFRAGEVTMWTADYQCQTKQGETRWIADSSIPIRDEQGNMVGCLGILQDITERKRTEIALRESEERFRQMAENIQEVFWIVDLRDNSVPYVSPAYEEVWGRSCQERYKNLDFYIETIFPEDREGVLADVERQNLGELTDKTYRIVRPDGTLRWIRDRAFPIRDSEGNVYRITGIADDITERKQLEEQLLQAQKMESIGRLAGGIAHDFNNILTAIIGFTELAEEEAEPESLLAGYLKNILTSSERAAALTAQLLAFARKQIIAPQVLNLNTLLQETEAILHRLIGEHIHLTTCPTPDLGMVKGDPVQLQQVLINLAINARDAMPLGGELTIETANVTLRSEDVSTHPEAIPGDYILLSVRDSGEGMSSEVQSQIFEPFFTTKAKGKGTGMGLATCYGIVKQNRGYIWIESEMGKGTLFQIYLPRVAEALTKRLRVEESPLPQGEETILLVEDEPLVRDIALQGLRAQGYTVLVASHGAEALQIAQNYAGEIPLLVSDVIMPQMSGAELVERLKEFRPQTKILFISGYTDNTIAQQGILEEGVVFLQKPFTAQALARKVREALEQENREFPTNP